MIEPALSKLMKGMDSKYTLVIAAAKRARQLADGEPKKTAYNSDKPISVAVHEIAEEKITFVRAAADELQYQKELEKQEQE